MGWWQPGTIHNQGHKVRVFLTARSDELAGDALANYHICGQLGIDIQEVDENYLPQAPVLLVLN